MLPRKRLRPNPAEAASSSTSSTTGDAPTSHLASPSAPALDQMPTDGAQATADKNTRQPKQLHKARSWYSSWPRPPQATASTSVAKENIFGGTLKSGRAPDLSRYEARKPSDATSIASTNTATVLTNVPENSAMAKPDDHNDVPVATNTPKPEPSSGKDNSDSNAQSVTAGADEEVISSPSTPQRPTTSSGWASWWSRTPFTESIATTQVAAATPSDTNDQADKDQQTNTPPAPTTPSRTPTSDDKLEAPASSSWFGFWTTTPAPNTPTAPVTADVTAEQPTQTRAPGDGETKDTPPTMQKQEPTPKAGSTWAFWSTDSPKAKGTSHDANRGEIAVIGDQSEAHPKPMDEDNMANTPSKTDTKPKDITAGGKSTWRNKHVRPPSIDIESGSPSSGTSILAPEPKSGSGSQTPTRTETSDAKPTSSNKSSIAEAESPSKPPTNLLLPSFSGTYQMKENPSIIKQVAQFLLRTKQPPANHVSRLKEPPKIRNALSIGVHGLFPATYLRPMIGHPTGTSLRFATLGAEAIRKWADAHGCGDCEIEKVALEGDGKISERVDNLWKLMLNWIDHIRKADLIVMACHSQGVPVSIMLLEKLIDLGIISDAKIGVCAMAGVAMGPFPSHRSNFFMGSASELWEFGDPESVNSQRFEKALKRVLDYGARITFIGSIDDQVVPMESAVYSPAHHPYIYRAVFIDGRIHAPDFIAHLVGFALKLRNLGISDHGLIRELSIPLAGPLVSGEGHSRLYFDPAVYDLAVTHALETTSTPKPAEVEVRPRGALGGANPYVLPWIMRGMLEEDLVKTELSAETDELLRQFDDWKPTNKALKEVKYRLEAVRSRL